MSQMTSDEAAIANLVYGYAEHIDTGHLEDAAGLLARARIKWHPSTGEEMIDATQLLEYWRRVVILYEDGTPQTKHLITNPIITVSSAGNYATCSSYYTVLQIMSNRSMDVILSGRYFDEFERMHEDWHYTSREYGIADFVGDVSRHRR